MEHSTANYSLILGKIFKGTVYKPRRQWMGEGIDEMSTLLNNCYK